MQVRFIVKIQISTKVSLCSLHLVCVLCIVRLMLGLIFVTVNWLVNFCAYLNFHNETLSAGFPESCNYALFAYMFSFMN